MTLFILGVFFFVTTLGIRIISASGLSLDIGRETFFLLFFFKLVGLLSDSPSAFKMLDVDFLVGDLVSSISESDTESLQELTEDDSARSDPVSKFSASAIS